MWIRRLSRRGSRRLVGHNDRAGGCEHTADAMADRDLGAGDLGGGGAAHLAHALPRAYMPHLPDACRRGGVNRDREDAAVR